jgi:hypothetical protein
VRTGSASSAARSSPQLPALPSPRRAPIRLRSRHAPVLPLRAGFPIRRLCRCSVVFAGSAASSSMVADVASYHSYSYSHSYLYSYLYSYSDFVPYEYLWLYL